MQSLTRILQNLRVALLVALTAGLALQAVHAAPGGKGGGGGGGKVSVTDASPGEADQGATLDVWIIGEGFDEGSTASFLVSGTSDDSQVIVNSTTYETTTGKLRSNITVKGEALVTEYDIEVRNSSGRRGKGTTLFRVKQKLDEAACTGFEDPSPEIAYLTEIQLTGDRFTADIYLASGSGCDEYLLLPVAEEEIRSSTALSGEKVLDVTELKFDLEGDLGVISWRDTTETLGPKEIWVLEFIFEGQQVVADPDGPRIAYTPPADPNPDLDWRPYGADVRINSRGEIELILTEKPVGVDEIRLVHVNVSTGTRAVLLSGDCPILDGSGACFRLGGNGAYQSWWNADGSEVYFISFDSETSESGAITRMRRTTEGWGPAEVLMRHNSFEIGGISSLGVLLYRRSEWTYHKNGRPKDRITISAAIDPEQCVPFECDPGDGTALPMQGVFYSSVGPWTRDGGVLVADYDGSGHTLRKYADPFSAVEDDFGITHHLDSEQERDTSF